MQKKDNMDSAWPERALYLSLILLFIAEVVAASQSLGAVPAKPSLVGNTFTTVFLGFVYGLVGSVWFSILLGTTFYRTQYKHDLRQVIAPLAAAAINFNFLMYGCYLMAAYGDPLLRYAIYAGANESEWYDEQHTDLGTRYKSVEAQEVIVVLICGFLLGSCGFNFYSGMAGIAKLGSSSRPSSSIV